MTVQVHMGHRTVPLQMMFSTMSLSEMSKFMLFSCTQHHLIQPFPWKILTIITLVNIFLAKLPPHFQIRNLGQLPYSISQKYWLLIIILVNIATISPYFQILKPFLKGQSTTHLM